MIGARLTAFALNFYSPVVEAQLRSHRKTATIRLGDKSRKYQKGMIVSVLVGARYGPRQHVFDAVIDKVEVKRLDELSPREIEHDNPEVRRPEEMAHFLSQLYNREVTGEDTVTVIRFSAINRTRLPRSRTPKSVGSRSCAPHSSQSTAKVEEIGAEHDGAAVDHLAAARRALRRHLGLELLEPAPGRAAAQADRRPVAEHLAPLLAQPVGGLAHDDIVTPWAPRPPRIAGPGRAGPWLQCGTACRSRALPNRAGRFRRPRNGASTARISSASTATCS